MTEKTNPNFSRPSDRNATFAVTGGRNRNFVAPGESTAAAADIEKRTGVAVRLPDESNVAYAKRAAKLAKADRPRASMAPSIARAELVRFERRYRGTIPPDEIGQYMNDCRRAVGLEEIDYSTTDEETLRAIESEATTAYAQFSLERSATVRAARCGSLTDARLLMMIAGGDGDSRVRDEAERRLGVVFAERATM